MSVCVITRSSGRRQLPVLRYFKNMRMKRYMRRKVRETSQSTCRFKGKKDDSKNGNVSAEQESWLELGRGT